MLTSFPCILIGSHHHRSTSCLWHKLLARPNVATAHQQCSHPRSRHLCDAADGQPEEWAPRRHHPPGSVRLELLSRPLSRGTCECHHGPKHAIVYPIEFCATGHVRAVKPYPPHRPARGSFSSAWGLRLPINPNQCALDARLGCHCLVVIRSWPGSDYEIGAVAHSDVP